jgi:hypothetical protein
MATFLELFGGQNEKEESRNGRMSGATTNRKAGRRFRKIEPALQCGLKRI